jgi:glyoxylase-like metal-dependent hydrolase (beta-lactamase superfamily II)
MYQVQTRGAVATMDRYVNVPGMPAEPRVVPVACPYGQTGGVVYVYYIDAPQPALVDTGVAGSPKAAIEPALKKAGIAIEDVRWILGTHGHWDHIGGAHAARAMTKGASLALHQADAELLSSKRAHMKKMGYQAIRFEYLDDMQSLAAHDAMIMENLSGELHADRELNGGERISLGGDYTIEVVHTPGHTPGSVTFVLNGLNWAFTGDSVQVCGTASVPLYTEPSSYVVSQKRLLEDVRPKRLHLGHRFRAPDGNPVESVLDGPDVERALRDSIAMHDRLAEIARGVTSHDPDQPRAENLKAAARALGFQPESPATWPAAIFVTLHGHLARRATSPV